MLSGKEWFSVDFDFEKKLKQLIGKVTPVYDPRCCPLIMYLDTLQSYIHSLLVSCNRYHFATLSRTQRISDLGTEWDKLLLYLQDVLHLLHN